VEYGDFLEARHKNGDQIFVTGHSLGGGVAALFSIKLRERVPNLKCYTFGAPPTMSKAMSESAADMITAVVNRDDVVPRLTKENVVNFMKNLKTNADLLTEYQGAGGKLEVAWRMAKLSLTKQTRRAMTHAQQAEVRELVKTSAALRSRGYDISEGLTAPRLYVAGKIAYLFKYHGDVKAVHLPPDDPLLIDIISTLQPKAISDHASSDYIKQMEQLTPFDKEPLHRHVPHVEQVRCEHCCCDFQEGLSYRSTSFMSIDSSKLTNEFCGHVVCGNCGDGNCPVRHRDCVL